MKIVKSANLIVFLNRLVFPSILADSQPLDRNPGIPVGGGAPSTGGANIRFCTNFQIIA